MSEIFDREERSSYRERRLRAKQAETQDGSGTRSPSSESEHSAPQPSKKKPRKRLQPERKIRARVTQTNNQRLTISLPRAMIVNLKLMSVVSGKTISEIVEDMLLPELEDFELTESSE